MPPRKPPRPKTRDDFEIAIICALTLEADAVIALFDRHWDEDDGPSFGKTRGDPNAYSTGVIGHHNVVLAHLPGMGKVAAGNIAAFCRMSFPNINLALVVGICGGAPLYDKGQILLGDVIISTGVVQYDLGRRFPDKFEMKDTLSESLGRPNLEIRSLLSKLTTARQIDRLQTSSGNYLDLLCQDPKTSVNYPGRAKDILFSADYRHKHQNPSACTTCASCQSDTDPVCEEATKAGCDELGCDLKQRLLRHAEGVDKPSPTVHFGTFASGDTVMKSGRDRDQLTFKNKAIGFEMESVGVWEIFPCVVIKSVCDYADSHKNKDWQDYAAASAAACTKAFLGYWDSAAQDLQAEAEAKQLQQRLLESLSFLEMNERRNTIASETPSTFQWIFDDLSQDHEYSDSWEDDDNSDYSSAQSYRSYYETRDEHSSSANSEVPDEINIQSSVEGSDEGSERSYDEDPNLYSEEDSDRSSDEEDDSPILRRRARRRHWDSFEQWLVSDKQTYWISGKPGSGKSTLMKFLLSNPRTAESLGRWREGTIILSHFFWKPGSAMQRSFKGFLCSLLYQLLDKDTNSFGLLYDMMATARRASPSDWDQRELCNILYDHREQSSQSVCIFIDALDEAAPGQDTLDMLEFVKAFASPDIKICVSSRPERFFELHLREYPHLRMHRLIKNDIVRHTMKAIRKSTIPKPRDLNLTELAKQVAKSADGVFLWAVLVTRSLIRGINNGESKEMIQQRLDSMPKDLMDLYRDVILRSAEDRPIYQKYVSMVLNLLFLTWPMKLDHHGLTVFECMLIMNDKLLDSYVVQGDEIPLQSLQAKAETMRNILDVGCDGFLKVVNAGLAMNSWIAFTHRAAQEFLLDTTEGRSLWKPCDISKEELWTRRFKATLAKSRLELAVKTPFSFYQGLHELLDLLNLWQAVFGLPLELVTSYLKLAQISYVRGFLPEGIIARWLVQDMAMTQCAKGQFLVFVAQHKYFQFVLSNLDNLEESSAQETMYCIFYNSCVEPIYKEIGRMTILSPNLEIVRFMLSNGYIPNWNVPMPKENQLLGSPWLLFLAMVLNSVLSLRLPARQALLSGYLELIQMFLDAGASIASRIPILCYCKRFSRVLRYCVPAHWRHTREVLDPTSTASFFFVEMNANAMVDLIVRCVRRTSDYVFQLSLSEQEPHMKTLAFVPPRDNTLFVVESESAPELLTEIVRETFSSGARTKHGTSKQAETLAERCEDIMEQLKPYCRPTKDPYFWKEFELWQTHETPNWFS